MIQSCAFFAMARLRGPAGAETVRYLCLLDLRSRQMRTDEKRLLADLAGIVSDQLELPGAIIVEEPGGRTADMVEITTHRDRDLSAANGAHGPTDGESQIAKLEARVHELEELNASLAAELRGVPAGSSDNETRPRASRTTHRGKLGFRRSRDA